MKQSIALSHDFFLQAASRDGITVESLAVLHESDYDTGKALQGLLKVKINTLGVNVFFTHYLRINNFRLR